MTDIVERLRQDAGEFWAHRYEADVLLIDAADEIDKLRAQVISLQSSLDAGPPRPGKKTPNALEGDNS